MLRQGTVENIIPPAPAPETDLEAQRNNSLPASFAALIDETLIQRVRYPERLSVFEAIKNTFYIDNSFSFKELGIVAAAPVIGGLASVFVTKPASEAVDQLTGLFTGNTTYHFPGTAAVKIVSQSMSITRTTSIVAFTALNMLHSYLGKSTPAEIYLIRSHKAPPKHVIDKFKEKVSFFGRQTFNLVGAIAASVPVFLVTSDGTPGGIVLSLIVASTNVCISWVGNSNIPLTMTPPLKMRVIESRYLHQQIADFIKLPRTRQIEIINEIDAMSTENGRESFKQIYLRLLTLTRPANTDLQLYRPRPPYVFASSMFFGAMAATAQLVFIEAAGVGTARIFADPMAPLPIILGTIATLLALLPNWGFSFTGGYRTGKRMTDGELPLAALWSPMIRHALHCLGYLISCLASGILIYFAFNAAKDVSLLFKLNEKQDQILKLSFISFCFAALTTHLTFYSSAVVDQSILFFSERCADDDMRRIISFVKALQHIEHMLNIMPDDNYLALLDHKLEGGTPLSKTMYSIFNQQLSNEEQGELRERVLKNRRLLLKRSTMTLFPDVRGRAKPVIEPVERDSTLSPTPNH